MIKIEWKRKYDKENGYYFEELHMAGWSMGMNIKVVPSHEQFVIIGNTPLQGEMYLNEQDAMAIVEASL